jgi:hypothetical protein
MSVPYYEATHHVLKGHALRMPRSINPISPGGKKAPTHLLVLSQTLLRLRELVALSLLGHGIIVVRGHGGQQRQKGGVMKKQKDDML